MARSVGNEPRISRDSPSPDRYRTSVLSNLVRHHRWRRGLLLRRRPPLLRRRRPCPLSSDLSGQRNYEGLWWSSTTRGMIAFESLLERQALTVLDHDVSVVAISAQPFALLWPRATPGRGPHQDRPSTFPTSLSGWSTDPAVWSTSDRHRGSTLGPRSSSLDPDRKPVERAGTTGSSAGSRCRRDRRQA